MWLHASAPLHIVFNMLSLWMFGAAARVGLGIAALPALLRAVRPRRGLCHPGAGTPASTVEPVHADRADAGRVGRDLRRATAFTLLWPDRTIMLLFPPIPIRRSVSCRCSSCCRSCMGGGSNVSYVGHLGGVVVAGIMLRAELRRALGWRSLAIAGTGCACAIVCVQSDAKSRATPQRRRPAHVPRLTVVQTLTDDAPARDERESDGSCDRRRRTLCDTRSDLLSDPRGAIGQRSVLVRPLILGLGLGSVRARRSPAHSSATDGRILFFATEQCQSRSRTATSSTWCVCGSASSETIRRKRNCPPMRARSRARVAGSHET